MPRISAIHSENPRNVASSGWEKAWSFLAISALVTGFAICAYLEAVRLSGAFLPCQGAVCGKLERDPLNANPYIKLSSVGLAGYSMLLGLTLVAMFGRSSRPRLRLASLLAGAGFVVSIGLVGYVLTRYHGLCPWCEASAVCMGLAALALVSMAPRREGRDPWLVVAGVGAGLTSFALILVSQKVSLGGSRTLSSYSAEEIAPERCWMTPRRPRSVALVDFGCGSCRQLMQGLLGHNESFALRIVPASDPYASAAAALFYQAEGIKQRREIVRALLDDSSMTSLGVRRIASRIATSSPLQSQDAARDDANLARALGVKATPVFLILDGNKVRAATSSEIMSASSR